MLTQAQIERRFAKQREYQVRARQRQIEKTQSPEYQAKQREKQRAAIERQREKAKQKQAGQQSGPVYTLITLATRKPLKSKGMAGKTRKRSDHQLHDAMAKLGCICCINKGLITPFSGAPVSIHHINGRTADNAHEMVLPLCAWHHDTPLPKEKAKRYPDVFPIHAKGAEGGKRKWEDVNGSQYALLEQVRQFIKAVE